METDMTPLTTLGASRILDLSPSGVIRLERLGRLTAIRDSSGRRLFQRRDVERLARERERSKADAA
jgi:DNA-binding transcriptional MerR regulator